jgi:hypothetical protein
VEMAYLDTGGGALEEEGAAPLATRALDAAGVYESRLGDRHQLRLSMRARSADMFALRLGTAADTAAAVPGLAGVPDPMGWGLRLDAEDAIALTRPLTLVYGVAYEDDVSGSSPGRFVQRAGAVWSAADVRLDLRLSRHDRVAAGDAVAPRLVDPIGWSGSLELPLVFGVRLRAEALAAPMHDEVVYRDLQGATPRPVYLTDGTAATRQERVTLRREGGRGTAYVQLVRGSAEGMLARIRPSDLAVGSLDERRLDFVLGRVGVRVAPTGTDLVAEYRKVLAEELADTAAASAEQEYVEVRIAQDLLRLSRVGSWRLLLAARATQDAGAAEHGTPEGTRHWMGAGLSVAF